VYQTQEKIGLCYVTTLDSALLVDNEQIEMEATIPDDSNDDSRVQDERQELLKKIIAPLSAEDKRLVLLRKGVVDMVDNSKIKQLEVLHEILRQIACKTVLHQTMAERIDTVRSVPLHVEEIVENA
jgi:hypothetical protein